jgi:Tetratricopeptide repeat
MEIAVSNKLARWLLILATIVLYVLATVRVARTYLAGVYAGKMRVEDLQRAIQLDPANSAYHLELGGLYEYMPTRAEPEKAMAEFHRAAELSPDDPGVWINLGGAAEFAGNVAEAEKYLRQADYLAPRLPLFQWRIGNFYLLHGNSQEAFAHFKMVLAGTRDYDPSVFATAWKASGDAEQILNQLIPNDLPAEFSYLHYLVSEKRYPEANQVWKLILSTPGTFLPRQVYAYMDDLIWNGEPGNAFQVWQDLQKKGLLRFPAAGDEHEKITNGNFEDDLLDAGFTWRIEPVEGAYAGLDTSTFHSPSHSLLVVFTGTHNLNYRATYQYVKVRPGTNYRLQAFLKTEGITTNSGPRLEVRDFYNPTEFDKFSDDLTGTSEGWTSVLMDFKTAPQTQLLVVGLARLTSQKLDNQIAGKVWLDDVSLTPLK